MEAANQIINVVPNEDDKDVLRLLDKMNVDFDVEKVPVKVEPSIKDSCYYNVQRKIAKDGGKIHYGWAIWQLPYMVEAEHHAVWEDDAENLLDISPRDFAINEILFVSDNSKIFTGKSIFSVRLNRTNNTLIDDLILIKNGVDAVFALGERMDEERISLPDFALKVMDTMKAQAHNIEVFYFNGNTKTSNCFCNSGHPYKQCHGKDLKAVTDYAINAIKQRIAARK